MIFNFAIKKEGGLVYLKDYLRGNCVTYDILLFTSVIYNLNMGHLNIEIKLGVYYVIWLFK